MADLAIPLLKLLTASPFQRRPRPKVTVPKLVKALGRMNVEAVDVPSLVKTLQTVKARGFANTTPKILLPEEIDSAEFEIWLTPLGRDNLGRMTNKP